jgi:hypothetical protein
MERGLGPLFILLTSVNEHRKTTSTPLPTTTPAPAGTYSVLVTGTATGGIRNAKSSAMSIFSVL